MFLRSCAYTPSIGSVRHTRCTWPGLVCANPLVTEWRCFYEQISYQSHCNHIAFIPRNGWMHSLALVLVFESQFNFIPTTFRWYNNLLYFFCKCSFSLHAQLTHIGFIRSDSHVYGLFVGFFFFLVSPLTYNTARGTILRQNECGKSSANRLEC